MATTSDVSIVSAALVHLGRDPIATLEDAGRIEAVVLRDRFAATRDKLLRTYPWNFAMRYASLPGKALEPARFGYTHACTLPSGGALGDCLRVWRLGRKGVKWQVVGGELYVACEPPVPVSYLIRQDNPETFDPIFSELLAIELALNTMNRLATPDAQKSRRELFQFRRDLLRDARLHDAMEASPPEQGEHASSSWLEARRPK